MQTDPRDALPLMLDRCLDAHLRVVPARTGFAVTTRIGEQFRRVYAFKSPDVEEWIDIVWHRPIAAVLAMLLLPTPIGPNLVTLMSFVLGISATGVLIFSIETGERMWRAVAALLAFASVIFDCADGQLARAKGGGTRWGRILDGLVDFAVLLGLYVTMWYATLIEHGWGWAAVAFIGGWSGGVRIWIYDKLKSIYLSFVQPSESDGGESLDTAERQWEQTRREGNFAQKVGMFIYVRMLLAGQEKVIAGPRYRPELDAQERAAFRERHLGAVRTFTLLGLGTHMAFVYTAILLSTWFDHAFEALHLLFLVPYNVLFGYVLWRNTPMRRGVGSRYEDQ